MSFRMMMDLYNFCWMIESHAEQRKGWRDAEEARAARERAEARAEQQARAMLDANPSGALGGARLNDRQALIRSGLL